MMETREASPLPPDRLALIGNVFIGHGFVYRKGEHTLNPVRVRFEAAKGKPLFPFTYTKPIENPNNRFSRPLEFKRDDQPREGYYPISHVDHALRPPNHMYEADDAFFAAVNQGSENEPKWEIQYFPKGSIDPNVWKEAMELLGITTPPIEIRTPGG